MSFRNDNDAHHEKEKAELRNKLRETQNALEAERRNPKTVKPSMEGSVDPFDFTKNKAVPYNPMNKPAIEKSRAERAVDDYERKLLNKPMPLLDYSWDHASYRSNPFRSSFDSGKWLRVSAIASVFVVILGVMIHHEFYDIRDGYVTDKNYTPGHWTTSCTTRDGRTRCSNTYHPPTWSVTVTYEGDSASWNVTENEYEHLAYGEWYCSRDLFHTAPCVRNHPSME